MKAVQCVCVCVCVCIYIYIYIYIYISNYAQQVNEINGNGSCQVSCTVPYSCPWRQALQCSHTRHLRSVVVISELPLSSRDMVTFRRSVGQNAP